MAFDVLPLDLTRVHTTDPRHLGTTTFVVQRRVNIPLTAVQRGLADRTRFVADGLLDLGTGVLAMDGALHPVAPFSPNQPVPTWAGRAQLLSLRGRRIATIELDVSMWSRESTCITLRPVARQPQRWSARRLRQYFALAHSSVDAIGTLVVRRAIAAAGPSDAIGTRDRDVSVTAIDVVPVGSYA